MSFTQVELDCLASCSEGWELIWSRLWEALDERLQSMLMHGSAGDPAWSLKSRYWVLRDVHTAQDFVCDFLIDLHRKAASGTLLEHFEGSPEQVLSGLASSDFVLWRARDYVARHAKHGIIGMPDGGDTRSRVGPFDPAEADAAQERGSETPQVGVAVVNRPLEIAWDPSGGVDAKVRMAALQCWFRLSHRQRGRDQLESDLRDNISVAPSEDPLSSLAHRHETARERIFGQLEEIDQKILSAPRMHAPRRAELEAQRTKLEATFLLEPLDREDVQVLLSLKSSEAAYKQLSRYRKAFAELFPCLLELHETASGGSSG